MAGNAGSSTTEVFDVRKIRRFVELMKEHELTEIDLRQGEERIRLRRGSDAITVAGAAIPAISSAPVPAPTPTPKASTTAPTSEKESQAKYIDSPMVGTFYSAASPDQAPFVKVGDRVGPDTTVCIVEAMKVFNEIPAQCSGTIVACLIENGEPVEFGQPLFQVQEAA